MRLLYLNSEGISKLIEGMEKECKAIKKNALRIAWYLRGGITYTDILNMSPDELKNANEIIEENLETTKKSNIPFF
jgi:hypothetical protein